MMGPRTGKHQASRRTFLKQLQFAPLLFYPAPIYRLLSGPSRLSAAPLWAAPWPLTPFGDDPFLPRYPEKSPLDDVLGLAAPGTDEYVVEGYVSQLMDLLQGWSRALQVSPAGVAAIKAILAPEMEATRLAPVRETKIRSANGIEVTRREFASEFVRGNDLFLSELSSYLSPLKRIEVADFEIYECAQTSASPLTLNATIRYEFAGTVEHGGRESRIGSWSTRWSRNETGTWQVVSWKAGVETLSRAMSPLFVDITHQALGGNDSYKNQLLHGADYWRTILDGAIGVDVYGNNGVAAGDFDNDGRDDFYVCQPAGLPNRLFRNKCDGTFEDVTEKAGVGVLDFSACALFADFENRGLQDLLVVCATGPLLFVNDGKGRFSLKKDAFKFAHPPQGSFTHAAIADYDRDGRLDIYFCLYSYYQGLDQYRYPVPYFDARNGPPNYLFRNTGNWSFEDRTEAAGLNVENDRYSFACSWGDCNGDRWPDLYVVNDFGRNVLYRNNTDGTFAAVSNQAQVDEAGAGMSACWLDFDNDGKQDIYAAGMWVAAGMRVFEDAHFHPGESEETRTLYRRHMTGNSLYRNQGEGKFENVGEKAGVAMGRWSWSTEAWDFDHDGFPDLYVANGYISGLDRKRDVSSFFWRQVVANSPKDSAPSPNYERGWGAINELIRSDSTWNGYERNVFLANNGDGTFSDVSGISGLDLRDDSRAFALADLDGDGKLEIILKNRNAPQIRILRLGIKPTGKSIVFRLRGEKSNRDAIGAAVAIEAGTIRQTKYVQAGSGFLSQHTKDLFFGLGERPTDVAVIIHWPSGLTQNLSNLPVNHRIEIREGLAEFHAEPFSVSPRSWENSNHHRSGEDLPSSWGTWLVEPVSAPEFSLPDLSGNLHELRSYQGKPLLLHFCRMTSDVCRDQLRLLARSQSALTSRGLQVAAICFDEPVDVRALKSFASTEHLLFPVLLATPEMAGIYNIIFRYLFDRHRDLSFPTSLLIDESGNIVKVYQGVTDSEQLKQDVASIHSTATDRLRQAIPFPGTLHQDQFQRNALTYGVAFFQHGFLDQAERAFQKVIATKPDDADAYYNLGTLHLRRNALKEAKENLGKAAQLRPNHAEVWNNLGMLAAQQGDNNEAIKNFKQSLELRPAYGTALLNLGNLYRRMGDLAEAEKLLRLAHDSEPANAEVNYSLGMLYARRNDNDHAEQYLRNALKVRAEYPDALNNLGVLLIQERRYDEAAELLRTCVEKAPDFDQGYLNLARLYVVLNDKEKARAVLESLLKKQPQHKMAQQMLQLLY